MSVEEVALRPTADRPPTATELTRLGEFTLDFDSLLDATLMLGGGGDDARGGGNVGVGGDASSILCMARA
jgi:hypothetical protein